MKIKGFNHFDLQGSFVYFIFSRELLYIGETQKITFSRWVQHFYKQGSFSTKVKKYGNPDINYYDHINLLSIELDDIRENFLEHRWRLMSQAIEHALHEVLIIDRKDLIESYYHKYEPDVEIYKIVSDTTRTIPKLSTQDWKFARNYARELLNEIYNYL